MRQPPACTRERDAVTDRTRVVVLGAGRMGSAIAALLREKPALDLAGVFGRARRGRVTASSDGAGPVEHDLAALLTRVRPRVAIQATCSRFDDALPEIQTLIAHGVHVVSIAEELAYPWYARPEQADALDRLAAARGVTVLGTGVNPGFVLDLLVVVLSAACQRVDSIAATRVNDLSPYGPSVLADQGVGLTPEAFEAGVRAGRITGHHGFEESIAMVAEALGWRLERIEQSIEPIVSRVRRETPCVTVEPGHVAGCRHRATAWVGGRAAIVLDHPQQVQPHREGVETLDCIEITGEPHLRLSVTPEIPGGIATAALAVNVIPRVLAAAPGLCSMIDIPPPAAMAGPRIRNRRDTARYGASGCGTGR